VGRSSEGGRIALKATNLDARVFAPAVTRPVTDGVLPVGQMPREDRAELPMQLEAALSRIAQGAEADDLERRFPRAAMDALGAAGALQAPLPQARGGLGWFTSPEGALPGLKALMAIGHASLPVGRLYEGHANAIALVCRYGTETQIARLADQVQSGGIFGVWNTETATGLRLTPCADGFVLEGAKTFASGAGSLAHPLVTARRDDGSRVIVLPRIADAERGERADLSGWNVHGMRASMTGTFDFSGLPVSPTDIVGAPGDYDRQPMFSAGAWRFAAVQAGGIARVLDEMRAHLRATGRGTDPHQSSRLGSAAMACETANLWVHRAAALAENASAETADQAIAYVNLARLAVEKAGLEVLELAHRSVGLAGFLATSPLERLTRDLATYLRQPGPDRALEGAAQHVLATPRAVTDLWS